MKSGLQEEDLISTKYELKVRTNYLRVTANEVGYRLPLVGWFGTLSLSAGSLDWLLTYLPLVGSLLPSLNSIFYGSLSSGYNLLLYLWSLTLYIYYPLVHTTDSPFSFFITFIIRSHLHSYPSPSNINFFWNIGFLVSITIIIQIITGLLLTLNYSSSYTFYSIMHLIREVYFGWLIRYTHSSGASFVFL